MQEKKSNEKKGPKITPHQNNRDLAFSGHFQKVSTINRLGSGLSHTQSHPQFFVYQSCSSVTSAVIALCPCLAMTSWSFSGCYFIIWTSTMSKSYLSRYLFFHFYIFRCCVTFKSSDTVFTFYTFNLFNLKLCTVSIDALVWCHMFIYAFWHYIIY